MRVIHFAPSDAHSVGQHPEPLCGDWGSMDTDWTDLAGGATCEACRGVLSAGAGSGSPRTFANAAPDCDRILPGAPRRTARQP